MRRIVAFIEADEDTLLLVEVEPEEGQTDVTLNGEPVSAVAMPKYDKPVLGCLFEQLYNLFAVFSVKISRRLVGYQYFRGLCKGSGYRKPLLLSA